MTQVIRIIAVNVLFLHYSYHFIIHTDTCPRNKQSWIERSNAFICENPKDKYHCIQAYKNGLVETCMRPYKIKKQTAGCPYVKIRNGRPFLGNPFFKCDETDSGCPGQSHRIYRTNELYKYSACLVNFPTFVTLIKHPVIERTSTASSTKEAHSGLTIGIQIPVSVVITLLVVIACVALCIAATRLKLNVSRSFRNALLQEISLTETERYKNSQDTASRTYCSKV